MLPWTNACEQGTHVGTSSMGILHEGLHFRADAQNGFAKIAQEK
jgi:hypothetical protein